MGSSGKVDKKERKERKEKKEKKRSDTDGVHKAKKDDKKDKKERRKKLAAAIEGVLEAETTNEIVIRTATSESPEEKEDPALIAAPEDAEGKRELASAPVPEGALLPIAVPLADAKGTKKILKAIRKAAKNNSLKRGVKEVTKAIRKTPPPSVASTKLPGVVILAGDTWPMDVISHLPVACEDHNIPYIYLRSRLELGEAAATKRPTSVVMVMEKGVAKKNKKKQDGNGTDDKKDDDGEGFADKYESLVKLVQEETTKQIFW